MRRRKARTIRKALTYFDPQKPLEDGKMLEAFYVAREDSPINEILPLLLRSKNYLKILFSGPPGCGKGTELARLKALLGNKFHIIKFSAKQITNNFQITPDAFLYFIVKQLSEIARQKKLKVYFDTLKELIERIQGWETKIADVNTPYKQFDVALFEKIIKGEIPYQGAVRQVSKILSIPTANEVIAAINKTAKELEKKKFFFFHGKKILLLITDMDKLELDSARDLFIKSFLHITKLDCHVVCTFPLELKYEKEFIKTARNFSGVYYLQNFKIYNRYEVIDNEGWENLRKVIRKRMSDRLIDNEAIERIIHLSGGILFELINLVHECCIIAIRDKLPFIDIDILDEAERRIRTTYRSGLNQKDWQDLYLIHRDKEVPESADLTKLLNQYSITEYDIDEDVWYDVNQILVPILENSDIVEE